MADAERSQERLPSFLGLSLGALLLLVGALVALRYFPTNAALSGLLVVGALLTGAARALAGLTVPPGLGRRLPLYTALLWLAMAAVLLGLSLAGPVLVLRGLGAGLLCDGVLRLSFARRSVLDVAAAVAVLLLGVLLLAWPDALVLGVAVLLGVGVIALGLQLILQARGYELNLPTALRLRGGAVVLSLLTALGLGALGAGVWAGTPTTDAFYTPPAHLPSQAGYLLRSEPFTENLPQNAQGWRILFTTTDAAGKQIVSSGVVVVSRTVSAGPRPVIAWAHGTTGFAQQCAPSMLGLQAGALPDLAKVLDAGWAVVATDYPGLGTAGVQPYILGAGEAPSVLDSIRAAHRLDGVHLADQTVLWGHSQGGGAALWAAQLAPSYAPELKIVGVGTLAPNVNPLHMMNQVKNATDGSEAFAAYTLSAYSGVFSDVHASDYLRPAAAPLAASLSRRCLGESRPVESVISRLAPSTTLFAVDPASGAFGARLRAAAPTGKVSMPIFIGQGSDDVIISPETQQAYVTARCQEGGAVQYRTYAGRDHVSIVDDSSPAVADLITWSAGRFAAAPAAAPSTC